MLAAPWQAGEISRRIRHLLGSAPGKGVKLGKSLKWCLFFSPLKIKTKRSDFSQTTSRVSGNRATLIQGTDHLVNWLVKSSFFSSPCLGQLLFKGHGRALRNIPLIYPGRGPLSSPSIQLGQEERVLAASLSLSLIPVDSISGLFRFHAYLETLE